MTIATGLLLGVAAAVAAAPPQTIRVVILDCSGSMDQPEEVGGAAQRRIDIAREEIRQLARALPPSAEHPLALVLFDETADSEVFTDLLHFERALDAVKPNGGTAISQGLGAARNVLQQARAASAVFVLLYSDGENQEPDGAARVAAEERHLDRLFAARQEQGLATNVVVKRWGNANAQFVARHAGKPHWGLLDIQNFRIQAVSAAPVLSVAGVRWVNPDELEIRLSGYADVRGADDGAIEPLVLRCTNPAAEGDTELRLTADAPSAQTFTLQIAPEQLTPTGSRRQLTFTVAPLASQFDSGRYVVRTAPGDVTVTLAVPPQPRRLRLASQLRVVDAAWLDPVERRANVEVELQLDVTDLDEISGPWPAPLHFLIEPDSAVSLAAGSPILAIDRPGTVTSRLTLSRTLAETALRDVLPLRLTPQDAPAHFTLQPSPVDVSAMFDAPDAVETTVAISPRPAGAGVWTDVGLELARFEIPLTVVVRGPTSDSRFTIVAPPSVRQLEIQPTVLRSGEQTVTLRLEARCRALVAATISLELVPPPPTDVLSYRVMGSATASIIGPPPVQLVLADAAGAIATRHVTLPDTMDTYAVAWTTALLAAPDGVAATGLSANFTATADLPFQIASTAPVGQPLDAEFRVPRDPHRNFWLDAEYHVTIDVQPEPAVTSVIGSTTLIQAVIPAPFKRWLFGGLVGIGLAVLLVAPLAAAWRYQRLPADETEAAVATGSPAAAEPCSETNR